MNVRSAALRELGIVALYLGLVLLFLWPAPSRLGSTIVGGDFMYPTTWTFDIATQGILEQGLPPLQTRLLNYPEGGSLTLLGWSFILPIAVVRAVGGSVLLGTNLALVLHLVLGCYLAYRLALRMTRRRPESFCGALVFGLSPYVLSLVWNGQIEKLSHAYLPAIVLLVVQFVADRRAWALPVLALATGLLVATGPYNAIFAAYLAVATCLALIARGERGARRGLLARAAVAAAASFAGCVPFLVYRHVSAPSDLEPLFRPSPTPQLPGVPWPPDMANNATVLGWFAPGKGSWALGEALQVPVLHVHYLGWCCLALALVALVWGKGGGRWTSRVAAATAVVPLVVAHGYCLVVGTGGPASGIPLPLYWAYLLFPGLAAFAVPYRAVVVVSLCLCVLVASGLVRLGGRLGGRGRVALCALACAAILAETRLLSPVPFPLPCRHGGAPEVYRDIAGTGGCDAVLDVPNEAHGLGAGANLPFIYYQSFHGHPTPLLLHYGPVHDVRMTRFQRGLARACGRPVGGDLRPDEDTVLLEFGYLVLHEYRLPEPALAAARAYLDEHLELQRTYPADGIRLYRSRTTADAGGFRMRPDLPDGCR